MDLSKYLNKPVIIIWLDAQTEGGWVERSRLGKPTAKFKKLGRPIYFNDNYLYTSWDIGIEGNEELSVEYLPIGCIQKIWEISEEPVNQSLTDNTKNPQNSF